MDTEQVSTPSGGAAPPLADMLNAVLSNPALMQSLRDVMTSTAAQTQQASQGQETPPSTEQAAPVSSSAVSDGLASVLSNPEIMAKLPQMMAVLKPMLTESETTVPALQPHGKDAECCRNDLLLALKPFLSPERRRAVDAMLRISKLGEVLRHIK